MKGKPLLREEEAEGMEQGDPSHQQGVTMSGAEGHEGLGGMLCHCILALQRWTTSLFPSYFHGYSPAGSGFTFLSKV